MKEGTKQVKFCIHCGAEFPPAAKFCPDCGKPRHVAAERPATENPVVAETASVLSDPKKRRVAFVVIAVAVILVLGIALLAGGREAAPQGGDLPEAPPVSDEAEGSGETIPQDEEQEEGQEEVQNDVQHEVVDPSATLLPDIRNFLYVYKEDESAGWLGGRKISFNGCMPIAAYEMVQEELLNLLQEEKYQLTLRESRLDPHQGIPAPQYYFDYIGSGDIADVTDKYEEMRYDVLLQMYLHEEDGYFSFVLHYADGFVLTDPGSRTTRDVRDKRDGGTGDVISEPPSGNSSYGYFYGENGSAQSGNGDNDFFEKCSACHGSGRCTHCGGDDEVKKFQAGLGWVEQNCTFCTGGRCRSCGGSGKA